jgi:hypothetical protein
LGRGDICQLRTSSAGDASSDIEPFGVDRDGNGLDTSGEQGAVRSRVSWILDPRLLPRFEEHPRS